MGTGLLGILAIPLLLAFFVVDGLSYYISLVYIPVIIFIVLLGLGIGFRKISVIVFDVLFHIIALINWYLASTNPGGLEGLSYVYTKLSIVAIIDLIVLLLLCSIFVVWLILEIVFHKPKKKKKQNDYKIEALDKPFIVNPKQCLHCGICNEQESIYCKQCGNKL